LEGARAAVLERRSGLGGVEAALEAARHADMAAALSAGLAAGDPCPVCGSPLEVVPKRPAARVLERATEAQKAAADALDVAREAVSAAERSVETARSAAASNAADQERLAGDLRDLDRRIDADVAGLAALL